MSGRARIVGYTEEKNYAVGSPRPQGYCAFFDWARDQEKGGLKQTQCKKCGLWVFPQEKETCEGCKNEK